MRQVDQTCKALRHLSKKDGVYRNNEKLKNRTKQNTLFILIIFVPETSKRQKILINEINGETNKSRRMKK